MSYRYGGLFGGFNLNIDYWPEVTISTEKGDATFGSHRVFVNYYFQYKFASNFYAYVAPDAVFWSFKFILPGEREGKSINLNAENEIGLGLNFGASYVFVKGLIRLDVLYIPTLVDMLGHYEIGSYKIQTSLYWSLSELSITPKSWDTYFVLSPFYESYEIAQLKGYQTSINYRQGYVMSGLMISW